MKWVVVVEAAVVYQQKLNNHPTEEQFEEEHNITSNKIMVIDAHKTLRICYRIWQGKIHRNGHPLNGL